MLVFRNPGLIDLEAVRTFGVSVKQPGSFGRFGTGLKFAIATILRGGGEIVIYRGLEEHRLGAEVKVIRDETFHVVTLDGEAIGFTTQTGRDWQPWQVLRELACNAMDEKGEFFRINAGSEGGEAEAVIETVVEGTTSIHVRWEDLEDAYKLRCELFVEGEPIWQNEKIRILPGPSSFLFYRGVRVMKWDKPARFTYDILQEQILTEDRTIVSAWKIDALIREAILSMDNTAIIMPVITSGTNYHEGALNYTEAYGVKPSRAFLESVIEAKEGGKLQSTSANDIRLRHVRDSEEPKISHSVTEDSFNFAVVQLIDVGLEFPETVKFVTVEELPGECQTLFENGIVYVLKSFAQAPARVIALQLVRRWVEMKNSGGYVGADDALNLLAPVIVDLCSGLKRYLDIVGHAQERVSAETAALRELLPAGGDSEDGLPF